MIIVTDSSPLISLAILNELKLLSKLFTEIYIPEAVFIEITQSDKPFSGKLKKFTKPKIKSIENKMALSVLSHELDQGESEAIILALENNIKDILIDEQKGRKIAAANGLHPIGTIGILIQAKKLGLIKHIKPLLDLLICNNIRISDGLYNLALNLAKES